VKNCASLQTNKEKANQHQIDQKQRGKKITHDVVLVAPPGVVRIFTLMSATSPSTALVPFAPTLRKWLIPSEAFLRKPETYCTLLWYTYPPLDVCPEKVVPFVRVAVGMRVDCAVALPISQSLRAVL
jgi:hypothetical protein